MNNRIALLPGLALVVAFLPGCGKGPEAKFVLNDKTEKLAREAKVPVEKALVTNFGTPQKLVAWERLPVDFGGVEAKVVSASLDGDTTALTVDVKGKLDDLSQFPELHFSSGVYADSEQMLHVLKYDPKPHVVTLAERLDPPPAVGDTLEFKAGSTLREGRRLYMTHCEHCHGVSGDGNGPTAKYLSPLPRDYRLGVFKFTSTVPRGRPGDKVRRDDLTRIIREGIPGTYMPSFLLMDEHEVAAIVEYVRWLSMRGEFENKLDADLFDNYSQDAVKQRMSGDAPQSKEEIFKDINTEVAEADDRLSNELATAWQEAEKPESVVVPKKKRINPGEDHDSIARGRAVYLSAKAKCVTCHGVTGRGDGANTELKQAGKDVPGLFDDWGHPIKPRDLTSGIYRGGRRPVDVYRRIRSGIKGTPMPAFGDDVLSDDEVWDVVNYVLNLPHEANGTSITEKPDEKTKPAAPESHAAN